MAHRSKNSDRDVAVDIMVHLSIDSGGTASDTTVTSRRATLEQGSGHVHAG